MQSWFMSYEIVDDMQRIVTKGDGTFGSNDEETYLLVDRQRNYVAQQARVRPDQVIFISFNKL